MNRDIDRRNRWAWRRNATILKGLFNWFSACECFFVNHYLSLTIFFIVLSEPHKISLLMLCCFWKGFLIVSVHVSVSLLIIICRWQFFFIVLSEPHKISACQFFCASFCSKLSHIYWLLYMHPLRRHNFISCFVELFVKFLNLAVVVVRVVKHKCLFYTLRLHNNMINKMYLH